MARAEVRRLNAEELAACLAAAQAFVGRTATTDLGCPVTGGTFRPALVSSAHRRRPARRKSGAGEELPDRNPDAR